MDLSPDINLNNSEIVEKKKGSRFYRIAGIFYKLPLWLFVLIGLGISILILINADPVYEGIWNQLVLRPIREFQDQLPAVIESREIYKVVEISSGLIMTISVAFTAYILALFIGLIVGVIRATPPKQPDAGAKISSQISSFIKLLLYNVFTLYVEVLRGLPILVVLLMVAFVIMPEFKGFLERLTGLDLSWLRGSSPYSAVFALSLTYGAFISETFRAGIQSIERGQMEAARSVGMTYFQAMRYVVLPQAIRRVLPPLGNDLIAMIKDSSLVAILGVRDLTQLAKTSSGRTFRYMETYLLLAAIYLTMTIFGSMMVKWLERRMRIIEK